jgi:hypothetical protein
MKMTKCVESLHPKSSCTTTGNIRKEWYILGNVKLAESMVSEPCRCKRFISEVDFCFRHYLKDRH